MKFLLVGLGNRGGMWADIVAAHRTASLCGAVDIDPARRSAFQARYPDVALYPDLDTGLRFSGADAVLLVTPPDGHLVQAQAIAARKLPLLAEKPLATHLDEAAAIVRLAETAGIPMTIGLNFRYLPVSRAIRDLVAQNAFGTPGFGQFIYQRNRDGMRPGLNRYPLTMEHPMMLEQSIHHLDLLRFAYGREPEVVSCRTFNPPWSMYAHDANVACLIGFEGGLEATYLGTWTGGWNELQFEWRTDCAGGVIIQRELFSNLATARTGDKELTAVNLPEARAFFDDSSALLDAFMSAVADRTAPPCDGRDHLRSLALCFAAIEAGQTGNSVRMAEFHARHGLEMLA